MNKRKSEKQFWILKFGVIWGIIEGTVGWVFHLLHIHYMTPVLILIGIVCMIMAIMKTQDNTAPFRVAAIASLFKLSNLLLLTYQPASWVLAPVTHILFEGILVSAIAYGVKYLNINSNLRRLLILIKRK